MTGEKTRDFRATVAAELMEPGYGLEWKVRKGQVSRSTLRILTWAIGWLGCCHSPRSGVLEFILPVFCFLQVRNLKLPNIIQKVSDRWHYKQMFSDSLPTNCFTHAQIPFWICLWDMAVEMI